MNNPYFSQCRFPIPTAIPAASPTSVPLPTLTIAPFETAHPTTAPPPVTALAVIHSMLRVSSSRPSETLLSGAKLSFCKANPFWIGDGYCDMDANIEDCLWDGGDCCPQTCQDSIKYACNKVPSEACRDPLFSEARWAPPSSSVPTGCFVGHHHLSKLGDGRCDASSPCNSKACLYDGGDCCPETCFGVDCGKDPHPFHCLDPSTQALAGCGVSEEMLQWRGDGLCDDGALNTVECGFDGGDCCPSTCQGELCAVAARFACRQEEGGTVDRIGPEETASGARDASPRLLSSGTEPRVSAALRHCTVEMEACAEEASCLALFSNGVNSLAHRHLWDLWDCIFVQEGYDNDAAAGPLSALSATGGGGGGGMPLSTRTLAACIREHCYGEFVACERSVECFLSEASPLRVRLQGCLDSSLCDDDDGIDAAPTSTPTAAPTSHNGTQHVERAGLHLVAPYVLQNIAYEEIVVGRTDALPKEAVGRGALFLHAPCSEFTEEDGWYTGKIALFDRTLETLGSTSCNVYEALRLLEQKNVHGALIVDENEGLDKIQATWLGRDMKIGCFFLGIRQESANTFSALLRRNAAGVSLRLKAPANTCDTAHVSGVVVGLGTEVEVASCCAASDIVLSKIAYDFDYWELGVRLSPFCPAGTDLVPSSCAPITDVLEGTTTMCRTDSKVNGICEDGGHNATSALVGYGMDCGDCGVRVPEAHTTHGYPTHAAYEAAHHFLCERRKACGETLASRYQEYFGDGNFFSNRLQSLCSETKCSIPG